MPLYGQPYDSPDDAATAASYALERQPQLADNEYATIIVKRPDGKFYRTAFGTSGQAGQAPLGELFHGLGEGDVPVAVLHNHPGGQHARFDPKYLSDNDTAIGKGVKLKDGRQFGPMTMYLLAGNKDLRAGTGDMKTTMGRDRTSYQLQDTSGVLGQVPIDEIVQRIDKSNPQAAYAAAIRNRDMGDTVKPGNPAVTGKQRLAMVNAMTDGSMPGSQGAPPPSPQTAPPKPRGMDMGGAPQPLPPGANTFGAPMGAPAPSGLTPEQERAALIAALIRSNHHNNGTPTPMGAPQ